MLSGIKKLVKSIKEDNSIILRKSKSLSPSLPSYIYKNSTMSINRMTRASSLRKSIRRECSVNKLTTVIPAMMYAKIIVFINNRAYICTIDGNCDVNTVPCTMLYHLNDKLPFHLEHSEFILQFNMGNKIVLGKQFVEKYVDTLDYQRGNITLKDTVKLDIYNEIPENVIALCVNDKFFLARIDATQQHNILSLEMLDKLGCDTTQTQVSGHCLVKTEYIIPFEFDNLFYVVDNHHKYVILGLDFLTKYCKRIGKHYIQLENNLRVFYI